MAKENRTRRLIMRLKPGEYHQIETRFQKTTFQKLSEYCRNLLLEKPVAVNYRDRSLDDALEELALLRKELNAIGNNLNQAMKNINSAHGNAGSELWMQLLRVLNTRLEPSITDIKISISNYSELWLQKLKAEKA